MDGPLDSGEGESWDQGGGEAAGAAIEVLLVARKSRSRVSGRKPNQCDKLAFGWLPRTLVATRLART